MFKKAQINDKFRNNFIEERNRFLVNNLSEEKLTEMLNSCDYKDFIGEMRLKFYQMYDRRIFKIYDVDRSNNHNKTEINLSELTKYHYMDNHHLKFLFDDKIGSPNNSDAFYFIKFLYEQESNDISNMICKYANYSMTINYWMFEKLIESIVEIENRQNM